MKLDATLNLIAQELGSNAPIKSGSNVVVKLTLANERHLTSESSVLDATNWFLELIRVQLWPDWLPEETEAIIAKPVEESRMILVYFRSPAPRDVQKDELDALMDFWLGSPYAAVGENAFSSYTGDNKLFE